MTEPATPSPPVAPTHRVVLLLNFGGPRGLSEVPDFLYEILRDPNTIQLPFPQWIQDRLARFIALRRAPEVARQYGEIGGASPIVPATDRIAAALRNALDNATGGQALPPLLVAHRYLPGHAAQVVAGLAAANPRNVLALPLYPHFSYATTGSSLQQVANLLRRAGWRGRLRALRSYPDAPGYLEALSQRLAACLASAAAPPGETVVLCSAHGLPRAYVERGDPYRDELYRTVDALRQRFPEWRVELSFQSRVGPAEWLKPHTDQIIPQFAAEGVRHLVFVPISFVNDHIETLYEVGVTYFGLARSHGITPYRANAVEDHPAHIGVLAGAVRDWLEEREHPGIVALEALLPQERAFSRRWAWLLGAVLLAAAALLVAGPGWWIW